MHRWSRKNLLMCAIVKPIHSEVWYTVLLQPKGIRLQPWFKGFNSQPVHQSLLRELFQRPLLNQVPQELCVCQTYCLPQPSDCFYTLWRQLGRQIQLLSAVTACIEMGSTTQHVNPVPWSRLITRKVIWKTMSLAVLVCQIPPVSFFLLL